ncbi:MAG: methylmalonyl-CoA carboxyltransferase, partial [Dehalococcoidia bacterium]|nr:methylmalonyl-CoA carboxyltransferase [Dehalococcoidia bacterium]
TVGIIANQPLHLAGCLDVDASDKAARFIRFCDCFNIPLITITDIPGYLPGKGQEHAGIIRHGAKVLWAYAEATVPKITLVIRKSYGGAYIAMAAREMGMDYVLAWPTAEIAVMGADGAAAIVHHWEIKKASDPGSKLIEKAEEYRQHFANPYIAAGRGLVDAVIKPSDSRIRIVDALRILRNKRQWRPPKKHGNIPL